MANENDPPYSENEAFDEIVDKDPTVKILGYIEAIEGRRNVKNYVLFKFTLTNGTRRVTCLIWGDALIDKYQPELTIGRIICLDGAKSKACILNYQRQDQGHVPFELIIQANTVVSYYGCHQAALPPSQPIPEEVTFENIGLAKGYITIKGYLKTVFTQVPSQYQNMSFGCGSITDGIYKVTVQVANFVPVNNLPKGQYVKVTGALNVAGCPLRIECKEMTDIVPLDEEPLMDSQNLLRGVRTSRRAREE